MKTVLSNSMVAHVWAQQTQETGRSNNGNFWFSGDTIYSYRTPIARFVPTGTAGRIVLMSCHSYSITTSGKHMRQIGAATNYDYIRVPYIGRGGRSEGDIDHDKNLAYLVEQYTNEVGRITRARSAPESYSWEHLARLADFAIKYANAFGMAEPALNSFADRRQIEEARILRDAKNNTPAAIAARERKKVREAAKLAAILGDYEGAWRRAEPLLHSKLTRAQRREFDDLLRSKIMMRVEGEEILTSLGARFPIEHGKRAFAFILEHRMRGQAWETNGHKIHLGHFIIDSIDAAGNVKAGCHLVQWEEIERMARTLGLLPPQPEQVAA